MNEEEKDDKTKRQENIEKTKELLKTQKGKALIFFIFYFFFFLFLFMTMNNRTTSSNDLEYETGEESSSKYSISKIEKENFHFKYTYNLDDNVIIYEGDKNNDSEIFTITQNNNQRELYEYNNVYYEKINGVLSKIDNPYLLKEFIETSSIKKILKNSFQDSRLEKSDGQSIYSLMITTNQLEKIISKNNIDIADNTNRINLTTDKNGVAYTINYDISPYTIYKNQYSKANIVLEYSNYGKIDEITIDKIS